jgi:hypothetical protein
MHSRSRCHDTCEAALAMETATCMYMLYNVALLLGNPKGLSLRPEEVLQALNQLLLLRQALNAVDRLALLEEDNCGQA